VDTKGTGDEALLITAARDFARGELLERDRQWDQGQGCVADVLPTLAEMGFMAMVLPEDLGGLNCSYRTYAGIIHEIAYASPSTSVTLSVHNMVGQVLAQFGPKKHRKAWLSGWGEVENFAAFAVSESSAGSDVSAARTRAERDGDHYVVNGEKMWISNGMSARWFLTLVRTKPGRDKNGLSAILIDSRESDVERAPIHGKMGIRGSETAAITFSDTRVPCDHLVGAEGHGMRVCLSALDGGRIGIAAQATGIAEACLDEMIAYACEREQFDRPIAHFQSIQNMIADSAVELTAARQLIEHAAGLWDAGKPDPTASAKAKLFATESANRIAYRAVQIFAGSGYINEYRVEQLYRDARITTIYEGTSEIQRLVIARELLKAAGLR
jgi:alkylation response protein AidB-like acyl-CoA dehydrogenase